MIVVDFRKTDTAKLADKYVEIDQGSDLLLVTVLRSIINEHEDVIPETVAGIPRADVLELAEILKNAKFVAFSGWELLNPAPNTRTEKLCLL